MAENPERTESASAGEDGKKLERRFDQPEDAVSFYCENASLTSTGTEVFLQLYETIPGVPKGPESRVDSVRSILRATVVLSPGQAKSVGELLLKHAMRAGGDDDNQE